MVLSVTLPMENILMYPPPQQMTHLKPIYLQIRIERVLDYIDTNTFQAQRLLSRYINHLQHVIFDGFLEEYDTAITARMNMAYQLVEQGNIEDAKIELLMCKHMCYECDG